MKRSHLRRSHHFDTPGEVAVCVLYCVTAAIISLRLLAVPVNEAGEGRSFFGTSTGEVFGLLLCAGCMFFAGAAQFRHRRLSYSIALIAGTITVGYLAFGELSSLQWGNAWIGLNVTGIPGLGRSVLTILSANLTLATVALSGWRILANPQGGARLAVGIVAAISAIWFWATASPYRRPDLAETEVVLPEITILRVERRGLEIREEQVGIFKDGRFLKRRTYRQIPTYEFVWSSKLGVLAQDSMAAVNRLVLVLKAPETISAASGRAADWKGDGWFVESSGLLIAFPADDSTEATESMRSLFSAVANLPTSPARTPEVVRDVCLGFCYDAPAALGYSYPNRQCASGHGAMRRCD